MAPDERCTPHGLWNCTACAPPGPTLAEMVGRLRGEIEEVASAHEMALRMAGFNEKAVVLGARLRDYSRLAAALAEIDRRLTALEQRGESTRARLVELDEAMAGRLRTMGERLSALEAHRG